jgi:cold shock CspA family protein
VLLVHRRHQPAPGPAAPVSSSTSERVDGRGAWWRWSRRSGAARLGCPPPSGWSGAACWGARCRTASRSTAPPRASGRGPGYRYRPMVKDEKGYGRITGDDGYVYFAHIEAMTGFRSLEQGQLRRVRVSGRRGPERWAAEQQAPVAARAQVAHPPRVSARGHQLARALEGQEVDRRSPWLAGLAAAHLQHPRARDADAQAGQARDDAIEDVLVEPVGWSVVVCHPGNSAGGESGPPLRATTRLRPPFLAR